jgi:uncharacterized protein YlxW (UPF0749 family)
MSSGPERGATGAEAIQFAVLRIVTCAVLAATGFALPVAVAGAARTAPAGLTTTRLAEQVGALGAEDRRLVAEAAALTATRAALASAAPDPALVAAATARAAALAVLSGAVPVAGPGIVLTIDDPEVTVTADVLVDALQELRDAGAEAIALSGVRLVAQSYVLDRAGGGLLVDGRPVTAPYRLDVIGDAHALAEAMRFPGGVLDTVAARAGATATVTVSARVVIDATRPAATGAPGG